MTKRISLFIFFLIIHSHCFGSDSLKSYHRYINEAELAIISGHIKQANEKYKNAFKYKKKPFAQDLYNALTCAIQLRKNTEAMKFCLQLADRGVGKNYFQKKSIFTALNKEKDWGILLDSAASKKVRLDQEYSFLYKKLEELCSADQDIHQKWGASDHNKNLEVLMKRIDDSLSLKLMNLFKEYGYLSEFKIGVRMLDDTVLTSPDFSIIILHNYQGMSTSDTLFSTLLKDAVFKGELKPEEVARIEDAGTNKGNRPSYGGFLYTQAGCTLYINKYLNNKENLSKIDRARAELWLYPLSDYIRKLMFNLNNPDKKFLIYVWARKKSRFANEEAKKSFLSYNDAIASIPDCKPQ